MSRIILTVDIGTSSLKAALIDIAGNVIAHTRCRFPQKIRTGQDWIDSFTQALEILKPSKDLAAVVVSGNGPTLISVKADDSSGELLLWNDPVGETGNSDRQGDSPSLFIPRIRAYRSLFPASYEGARWLFSGPEYLMYCLTGNPVTILPDSRFEKAYWTPKDLADNSIDPSILPPFVLPASKTGFTNSRFPGLSAGIPVIAGGPDFIVAIIGTATLESGRGCDRAGTSEGLNLCVPSAFRHPEIRTLPSVIEDLWNASYLLSETGAKFHTYRKESGQTLKSYPDIMTEIEQSPIFPAAGKELHPGRKIVEEIAFSVRKGIEVLFKATGVSPVYYLSGGQARNEIWNQMKADITGSVFAVTATPDGELMGDAALGCTAIGEYGSIREAAASMVRVNRFYEPDPEKLVYYSEKFALFEDALKTAHESL